VRHQFHAQNLAGKFARLIHRFGELHAAALAASTGVDLRLHHDSGRARVQ
jgi:hypothetical protein